VGVRKLEKSNILKGLECCTEFLCGECPYEKYDIKGKPLTCVHKLIVDLYKMIGGNKDASS
jgi:hypothetical protein